MRQLLMIAIVLLLVATGAGASDLIITGVCDGPLTGGIPKAIEVVACADIADLSIYGLSSANNGAGPTGAPEFTFPADSVVDGQYIYVATEAPSSPLSSASPPTTPTALPRTSTATTPLSSS
ncbi:MAG: hypothetical protein JXB46_00230 [Candidatus Eisenbacteria bacterium]|nr:hypothetical protein [Candidatus Eisenbacteria bacterium]